MLTLGSKEVEEHIEFDKREAGLCSGLFYGFYVATGASVS